jgi:RimJ/RimL family protein N-acetyltransferase
MLRGNHVVLRRRLESDVAILEAALRDDAAMWTLIQGRPWHPRTLGETTGYGVRESNDTSSAFTVADPDSDDVLGSAELWRIDRHNRSAHIGVSLIASACGRGLGGEVVDLLCAYGFNTLGMHRLQIETLAENTPMIKVSLAAGFRHEGTMRSAAWTEGSFGDEQVYGLLDDEWRDRAAAGPAT